jgi:hypothetical protein
MWRRLLAWWAPEGRAGDLTPSTVVVASTRRKGSFDRGSARTTHDPSPGQTGADAWWNPDRREWSASTGIVTPVTVDAGVEFDQRTASGTAWAGRALTPLRA